MAESVHGPSGAVVESQRKDQSAVPVAFVQAEPPVLTITRTTESPESGSEAWPAMSTVPDTVVPGAGLVMLTEGGWLTGLDTLTVTRATDELDHESKATAES